MKDRKTQHELIFGHPYGKLPKESVQNICNVCGRFNKPDLTEVIIELFRRLEDKGII
jgi:hypothetical protein